MKYNDKQKKYKKNGANYKTKYTQGYYTDIHLQNKMKYKKEDKSTRTISTKNGVREKNKKTWKHGRKNSN